MFLFCRHKWNKVSDLITESSIEVISKALPGAETPYELAGTNRKHIVILTCDKCGKVNKIVTNL